MISAISPCGMIMIPVENMDILLSTLSRSPVQLHRLALRARQQFTLIHPLEISIFVDEFSLDGDSVNIALAAGIDEARNGIVTGSRIRPVQFDDDKVRALARLQRADLVSHTHDASALIGRH